jgi:flagellar hook assembly protein FlgD
VPLSNPFCDMVDLSIYDVRGALVKTLTHDIQPAGHNEVSWDGLDNHHQPVGSGIYFYKLTVGNQTLTRKMKHLSVL